MLRTRVLPTIMILALLSLAAQSGASHTLPQVDLPVLAPAIHGLTPEGDELVLYLDSIDDTFQMSVQDGVTQIDLFRADGERYAVTRLNAELGPMVKTMAQKAAPAPSQTPPAADEMSVLTFIDSGWTCYDQACARVTGDTSTGVLTHWIGVYKYAPTADYYLEACESGVGCGSIGTLKLRHYNPGPDTFRELSQCRDYGPTFGKDVWSANYRNKYGAVIGSASMLQIQTASVIHITGTWHGC